MKKTWHFPILVPLFGITVFLAWNWLQYVNLYIQAKDGVWYEEKVAKILLMKSLPARPDVVFVGSSRTMNQIDTAYLTTLGIKSFNLGLAGRWWQEYPSLVKAASRTATKAVVISIPINELFRRVRCPKQFTIFDAYVFGMNKGMFACNQMPYSDLIVENLPMNRFKTFIERRKISIIDEEKKIDLIKTRYGYDLRGDSRGINYIRGKPGRYNAIFRNGDGIIFSEEAKNRAFRPRFMDLSHQDFNPNALEYIRFLTKIITSNNITAVFVIEPSIWNKRFLINTTGLGNKIKPAYAISNAGINYGHALWSDIGHLNYQGIAIYTKHLYGQLKKILDMP